jgi:hypothetical protein
MAIINNDRFPYILTQYPGISGPNNVDYRKSTFHWSIIDFNTGFKNYWYCEIFNGRAFEVFNINSLIPADIMIKIKNDDETFLYISNSHEAFLDIVQPLYESLVIKEKIPAGKIIIASEAADLYIEVKNYADANNLEYFNVHWVTVFQANVSIHTKLYNLRPLQTLDENRTYHKRFLNFNRRWRLHRPALVALLKATNLLDKGFVSLGETDDGRNWTKIYPWLKQHNSPNSELLSLLESVENEMLNLPPLYLDTQDLKMNQALMNMATAYLYNESLISVVTETTFYTDGGFNPARFLSEKTFKPVGHGHPFIMVSTPKSLELFRDLGYKSFHPYIDESYDSELDDYERMLKIVKEIKRICDMNENEVKEFIQCVKPIVEFNQDLLISRGIGLGKLKNFYRRTL